MSTNSRERLRPKLAPDLAGHLAGGLVVRAALVTTAGAAVLSISLAKLLRLTESPFTLAAPGRPDTWVVIVCLVGSRVVWNVVRDGNNMVVVNAFLAWTAMAPGVLGLGYALYLLATALPALAHDDGVLDGS